MALDRNALKSAILAAMNDAESKGWSKDMVADAWASAIHAYVSGAEISGVQCAVSVTVQGTHFPEKATGSGSQNNAGPLNVK
jgi:hypothetical protein